MYVLAHIAMRLLLWTVKVTDIRTDDEWRDDDTMKKLRDSGSELYFKSIYNIDSRIQNNDYIVQCLLCELCI